MCTVFIPSTMYVGICKCHICTYICVLIYLHEVYVAMPIYAIYVYSSVYIHILHVYIYVCV